MKGEHNVLLEPFITAASNNNSSQLIGTSRDINA